MPPPTLPPKAVNFGIVGASVIYTATVVAVPPETICSVHPKCNETCFTFSKAAVCFAVIWAGGSGESTLVNILTKMLNYDQGDIFIGGVSYKKISEEKIRQLISVVPQNVRLFTGTIKENLLIAKDVASDEELYVALEKAQLINFVESLPDKLDTYIGELGKKLSGGESKRLAVARALLRNSPIIIFDEATSHLDTVTEKNILKMTEEISKSKSVLFVTHRLIQMEIFDNIIVLSDGKIVETSKHSDLIINGTWYKKMINSQNSKIQYKIKESLHFLIEYMFLKSSKSNFIKNYYSCIQHTLITHFN